MQSTNSKIIVALDLENQAQADNLIKNLSPENCRLKVGKSLFTQLGPQWVQEQQAKGFEIFLDLKFHDIPFQVARACQMGAQLGVWMINVHALGGLAMLKAAKQAVEEHAQNSGKRPLLIGVTLLTSMSEEDLATIGLQGSVEDNVMRLASLCYEAGLDGVVCSAKEVEKLKANFGKDFLCVTPGIRCAEDEKHDQSRVLTPVEAVRTGSDYLVMGRSITGASIPDEKLKRINEEIKNELV